MVYWQGASGSEGRSFADIFIRMGIFATDDRPGIGEMVKEMAKDDIFLLKEGIRAVRAVGLIVDDKPSKNEYLLFDGWKLTSYRNIQWYTPPEGKSVEVTGLRMGTLCRCNSDEVKKIADEALEKWTPMLDKQPLPNDIEKIEMEDVLSSLVRKGLRISDAERVSHAISHVKMLAQYYMGFEEKWNAITEEQVRAFLVLPLLLSVGWSEQCLALEFPTEAGRIDVAGFDKPFHLDDAKCKLVIEVKKFSSGLDFAPGQAKRYCDSLKGVQTFCVTNGFCYRIFDARQPEILFAHIDLLHLVNKYPLGASVGGAIEGLERLMPGHS